MAYSEEHAQILRDALSDLSGVTEKKMFGGLCFMLNGNMLCGVHKDGGMARVGKDNEAAALELDGVEPVVLHRPPHGRNGRRLRILHRPPRPPRRHPDPRQRIRRITPREVSDKAVSTTIRMCRVLTSEAPAHH
ncbi:MAG: hypothetical protein ACI92S_000993 [Planctomycetaceae bacterium]|jgi:hypothetical protein